MTYSVHLPEVFPYSLDAEFGCIKILVRKLLGPDRISPGSSFAVTADVGGYKRRLWLSEASFQYLKSTLDRMQLEFTYLAREQHPAWDL